MDTKKLSPIDQAKYCLNNKVSFVMQGGAGSGKTETLKDLLQYMSREHKSARIVCITHTNNAVDEIRMRIKDSYPVSTIHSFLYDIIKDYKKNIKSIIHNLFVLEAMTRETQDEMPEADYKKNEYDKYKKAYEKYADKLYYISKESCERVIGKREYDSKPEYYNQEINKRIESLNIKISDIVQKADYSKIVYNETKFNNFKDLSYGHDGLLDIAHLLFAKYPLLGKIISDKYDYVFIDEYQDTRETIINDLLKISSSEQNFTMCLFGDNMQSIYSDGIGDVNSYIQSGVLYSISKPDNYRCSYEVLDLINTLRLDDIVQKVALAVSASGKIESESERHGNVNVLYGLVEQKPSFFSSSEEKDDYYRKVDKIIKYAETTMSEPKILLLTNKAIAKKEKFPNLYAAFNNMFVDVGDRLDNYLRQTQITDLCELCAAYNSKNYNLLITSIKQSGFTIKKSEDKNRLNDFFTKLMNEGYSLNSALKYAFTHKLLKKSESYIHLIESNEYYLSMLKGDKKYQDFKKSFLSGLNTYTRIKSSFSLTSEEEFDYYKNKLKRETFINDFFSDDLKFSEAINYFNYANEESKYITMHKTKGSSIDSVIVVMEEYFWTKEYDFSLIYSNPPQGSKKRDNSQKLIYVACSRARKNLTCIKLITQEEEPLFLLKFPMAKKYQYNGMTFFNITYSLFIQRVYFLCFSFFKDFSSN